MNDKKGSKRILTALLGLACCGMFAAISAQDDISEFAAPLNVQYERPGVDYSQYDKLIINDIDVDNTKIIPPPWTEGRRGYPSRSSKRRRAAKYSRVSKTSRPICAERSITVGNIISSRNLL